MNQSAELVREIVKAARDGDSAISQMMDKSSDEALRGMFSAEREQYRLLEQDASKKLTALGGQAEPEGLLNRAEMWMGIQMETLTDRSSDHLAELFIQGNGMGLISMTRARNSCPQADQESAELCERFIQLQRDGTEHARAFLKEPEAH